MGNGSQCIDVNTAIAESYDDLTQLPTGIDVNTAIAESYDDLTQLPTVRAVFGLLYSLMFVLGMVGNGSVCLLMGRTAATRSASNLFLLNLVASDLLLCLTAVPVTPFAVIKKEWIFGSFLCRTIPLSQSWSVLITSWSLTAIAIDKYVHIRDATKAPVGHKAALAITAAIWLVSGLVNVPYMLSYQLIDGREYTANSSSPAYCGAFCEELNWYSESHRRAYGTCIMALQFVLPMMVITFCYANILAIVRRDMIVGDASFGTSLTSNQRKDALRRKRKVNYILIAMVVAFISAWFPLTLVNILRDFAALPSFIARQPWLWTLVVHLVAMTTVLWNPILFFWLTRKGRSKSSRLKRLGLNLTSTCGRTSLALPTVRSSAASLQLPSHKLSTASSGTSQPLLPSRMMGGCCCKKKKSNAKEVKGAKGTPGTRKTESEQTEKTPPTMGTQASDLFLDDILRSSTTLIKAPPPSTTTTHHHQGPSIPKSKAKKAPKLPAKSPASTMPTNSAVTVLSASSAPTSSLPHSKSQSLPSKC